MSNLSILIAILGLAILIVVHEWGHFIVARLCGMRVERFSVGFGKPLVSFKRGDTIYQLAPIPLGGFVQITGLNPHEDFDKNDPYVYPNRPRWMRMAVLVAGPAANYLTASILAAILFTAYGKASDQFKVGTVVDGSPAQAAGLQVGDVLVSVNGQTISVNTPLHKAVRESEGKPVTVAILRDGVAHTLSITPRLNEKDKVFQIGVGPTPVLKPVPLFKAIGEAAVLPVLLSGRFLEGIWHMIIGKEKANLSGPVGIARDMAAAARQGALEFIQLMLYLSVYLGLFNLLPLPALDGGRVLFLGLNALPIKQVTAKTEATVHMVGMLLLMGVFVLVTFKDIKELVFSFIK